MRRLSAYVVLYLFSTVISLLTSLFVGVAEYILRLIQDLGILLRIAIYLIGGSTFISLVLLPIFYGAPICVHLVELIHNSKKGSRYLVFSIYMLVTTIFYIVVNLMNGTFMLNSIIMCIYYIAVAIIGISFVKERENFST